LLEEPDELSGLLEEELLLLGDELLSEELLELPLDEPLLPSEPPIPELGLTPKYENTLCFHPGCDKSLVASNEGADCNLLVSPLKAKVCWLDEVELVELELLAELELLGFSKAHGTATCLPPLELELLEPSEPEIPELDVLELVPLLEALGEELAPEEPEELPELLSEIIAHSSLAEEGLIITSLMVPSDSPDVDCTVAPVNWLAGSSL